MSASLKDTLVNKIAELKENPEKGKSVFRAQTRLVNGVLTNASIRQFNLNIDEPTDLGGNDIAPNPVELLLAALGTCQEIVYSAYAEVLGIKLDAVEVDVKGVLDLQGLFATNENVRAGYEQINYDTTLITNESKDKVEQLISLVESHCPVLDTLNNGVSITGKVNILEKKAAA